MERVYIIDDGICLSAALEKPEGKERCPLVIHFHGFGSSSDRPHNIAACEAMREAGCATLRVDLFGHGGSGGEFRNHTLYKWIGNGIAAVEYARSLDFVTELYLAGHSQGGLTAALVAAMYPDQVGGLILRAPAFLIPKAARDGRMLGASFDPEHIPDEGEMTEGRALDGAYIRVAQTIRPEYAVDRFRGPVLILHGDQDDIVPLQDSVAAAARYADCRLEILEGENHHFNQRVADMKKNIREWLREKAG